MATVTFISPQPLDPAGPPEPKGNPYTPQDPFGPSVPFPPVVWAVGHKAAAAVVIESVNYTNLYVTWHFQNGVPPWYADGANLTVANSEGEAEALAAGL